jgi:hypothetical protein
LFLHLKKHLTGKKVGHDDEVQEEVLMWFKLETSMTLGHRSWFQNLINVWTMPATMLKNEVMYRQFIHSVTFVHYKCGKCLRPLYLYFPDTPCIICTVFYFTVLYIIHYYHPTLSPWRRPDYWPKHVGEVAQ